MGSEIQHLPGTGTSVPAITFLPLSAHPKGWVPTKRGFRESINFLNLMASGLQSALRDVSELAITIFLRLSALTEVCVARCFGTGTSVPAKS